VDYDRFDSLTRSLGSAAPRRSLVRVFGGGLAVLLSWPRGGFEVAAKHKGGKKHKKKKQTQTPSPPSATCTPHCRRKQCGNDGCGGSCGSCAAGQVCVSGTCCTPEPVTDTCAVDCGFTGCPRRCGSVTTTGACGTVACTCPSGEECLGNNSCAQTCEPTTSNCPSNCGCSGSTEGPGHCYAGSYCNLSTQVCTNTSDCPLGHSCQKTMCGPGPTGSPENRCWPLCGFYGL
jgi:hypothetical protein